MIVAVEGPNAAGKTTWCRRHAARFVAEYEPTGDEPYSTDPDAEAQYWVRVNSDRWLEAVRMEAEHGVAVCDSDPLKLHHAWCLAMTGATPRERIDRELEHTRDALAAEDLAWPTSPLSACRRSTGSGRLAACAQRHGSS